MASLVRCISKQARRQVRHVACHVQPASRLPPPSMCLSPLAGKYAWVFGGAGVVGRGICKSLLAAGATVIVNSSSEARLEELKHDLGNPSNLVCIRGTMLPSGANDLVNNVMGVTDSRLNHVVAHSGLRWWASKPSCWTRLDSNLMVQSEEDVLSLHFAAAQLLLPHLQSCDNSSYTFVTGGMGRPLVRQVNTKAIWSFASAMNELYANSGVRVSELRVRVKSDAKVKEADPLEHPLSDDLGELCAGLMANSLDGSAGLHPLDCMDDVGLLKSKFPYPVAM